MKGLKTDSIKRGEQTSLLSLDSFMLGSMRILYQKPYRVTTYQKEFKIEEVERNEKTEQIYIEIEAMVRSIQNQPTYIYEGSNKFSKEEFLKRYSVYALFTEEYFDENDISAVLQGCRHITMAELKVNVMVYVVRV